MTVPWNERSEKASTLKRTGCPTRMLPMSASAKLESICILERSWAMRNKVGVWKLAATVWPTSTCRSTTTPATGDRMTV